MMSDSLPELQYMPELQRLLDRVNESLRAAGLTAQVKISLSIVVQVEELSGKKESNGAA